MKILVTGFGPFLDHFSNPAREVAEALRSSDVDVFILPVTYQGARKALLEKLSSAPYDFILSFGLAAKRKTLTLEKAAYNERKGHFPDEEGILGLGEPIIPGRKKVLKNPLPVAKWATLLSQEGIPCLVSTDPGRYVCNEIAYLALASGIPCLFVHLPEEDTLSLSEGIRAGKILLGLIASKN